MKKINILSYTGLFLSTQIALAQSSLPPLPKTDAAVQGSGVNNSVVPPPLNVKAPPTSMNSAAAPVVAPPNVKMPSMSTTSADAAAAPPNVKMPSMSTTSAPVPMPAPMEKPSNLPVQTTTAPPVAPEIIPVEEASQQSNKGFFSRIISYIKGLFTSN